MFLEIYFLAIISIIHVTLSQPLACPRACDCEEKYCCIVDRSVTNVIPKCRKFDQDFPFVDTNKTKCVEPWSQLTLFLSKNSVSLPNRVNYDKDSCTDKIEQLSLVGTNGNEPDDGLKILQKSIFDEFVGNFSSLKVLTIRNIELHIIKGGIFDLIEAWNLEEITLKDNIYLKTLERAWLVGLNNLHTLNLQRNAIESVEFTKWGVQRESNKIQHLDLSGNRIKSLDDNSFSELGNVFQLTLDANQLSLVEASSFKSLAKLKILSLQNNNIKRLYSSLLEQNLDSLTDIYLSNNPIFERNIVPQWFEEGCPSMLSTIKLNNVSLNIENVNTNKTFISIKKCPMLKLIELNDNTFNKCISPMFFGVSSLDDLKGIQIQPSDIEFCREQIVEDPLRKVVINNVTAGRSFLAFSNKNGPFYILLLLCSLAFFVFLIFTISLIVCLKKYKKNVNDSFDRNGAVKKILGSKIINGRYLTNIIHPGHGLNSAYITVSPSDSTMYAQPNGYPSKEITLKSNGLVHQTDNEFLYATSMYNHVANPSPTDLAPSENLTPKEESNCSSSFNDSGFNQTMAVNQSEIVNRPLKNLVTSVSTFFPNRQHLKTRLIPAERPESMCIQSQNGLMYSSLISLNHPQLPSNTLPKSKTIVQPDNLQMGTFPSNYIITSSHQQQHPSTYATNTNMIYTPVQMNNNVSHFFRQSIILPDSRDPQACGDSSRLSIVL